MTTPPVPSSRPGSADPVRGAGEFTERLWPSPGTWAMVPLVALSCVFVFAPFGLVPAITGFVVAAVMTTAAFVVASPVVRVSEGRLRAGNARIEVDLLGAAAGFRGEEARRERGPRLDARAFLLLRGWVDPVVRVEIDDPADPTPYWLISTRRPDELLAALGRAT